MTTDGKIDCKDEGTVSMLYQRLGRPALSKTLCLVSQNVAEEIVQETFVKLWQKKPVFDSLRQAYAWVYRCCTNAAIDYLRSKGNQSVPLEQEITPDSQGLDPEQKTQLHSSWKELLEILSEKEAELFIYRNIEGLNQDEVAEVMGISRRTVNRLQEKVGKKVSRFQERRHAG